MRLATLILLLSLAACSVPTDQDGPTPPPPPPPPSRAGEFEFLPEQLITAPVPSPYRTVLADVNADGRDDLIWNHVSSGPNVVAVALADQNGRFGTPRVSAHPAAAPEGWPSYRLLVGDITGDGRADLLWSRIDGTNILYTAVMEADGSLRFLARQQFGAGNWSTSYRAHLGRFDGDAAMDLVFNIVASGTLNRSYYAVSAGDGRFLQLGQPIDHASGSTGWGPYALHVADLNRDGLDDLLWTSVPGQTSPNRSYVALRTETGLDFRPLIDHSTNCCWTTYTVLLADFDGDQIPDLYWNKTSDQNFVHRFRGLGNGGWNQLSGINIGASTIGFAPALADVNGDGTTDVVWVRQEGNRLDLQVGLASGGGITLVPEMQSLTEPANWLDARIHMGRVNPDARADVVVVIPDVNTRVFVGLARP